MDGSSTTLLITSLLFMNLYYSNSLLVYPKTITFNLTEFLRLRCSLNSNDQVITTWKGSVYLHIYQLPPKRIFDIVGMNIARCLNDTKKNQVILTTREAQLYLDPITGHKLIQWMNPYTGQTVPVMHVENDPVQSFFVPDGFYIDGYLTSSNQVAIPVDVNLFYPNPLYDNETLRTYSKERFYQAGEFFKFFTPLDQITNRNLTQVHQSDLSWTRISPVLPWMNMSTQYTATLVFSAQGSKVNDINQIDQVLLNEIINRIPLYKNAPNCQLDAPSETSWTYFEKYFAEYLSKTQEFPIPKSKEDAPCIPN